MNVIIVYCIFFAGQKYNDFGKYEYHIAQIIDLCGTLALDALHEQLRQLLNKSCSMIFGNAFGLAQFRA